MPPTASSRRAAAASTDVAALSQVTPSAVGMMLLLTLLGGAVALAVDPARDHATLRALLPLLQRAPDAWWSGMSVGGLGLVVVLGVLAWGHAWPGLRVSTAFTLVLGGVAVQLLKRLLQTPRPGAVLEDVHVVGELMKFHSMPSGHAAAAAGLWVLLWLHAGIRARVAPASRSRLRVPSATILIALGSAWALLVMLSRLATCAHWPSDVLAGAALGGAVAWGGTRWVHGHAGGAADGPYKGWRFEAWLDRREAMALVLGGAALCAMDTGYPLGCWVQWSVGAMSIGLGMWRFWHPRVAPGRRS